MRQTSAHSAAVTGCTDRRELLTSTILASFGLALAAASDTGFGMSAHGAHVDAFPDARIVLGILMGERRHLHDADDLLVIAGVIEEGEVAELHGEHILARLEVAHAVPGLAGLAARFQHLPREHVGLGLHQPIGRHGRARSWFATGVAQRIDGVKSRRWSGLKDAQSSALNGRCISCSMASLTLARPSMTSHTAALIGISMPFSSAMRHTAVAV